MRLNFSLSQKGLILVAGMLLAETLFVGTLAQMLNQAEQEALAETHSKEVVGRTNKIFQLAYDAGVAAGNYQTKDGGKAAAERFHADTAQLPGEVVALKELVKDNPRDLAAVERVEHNIAKLIKMVSYIIETAENGSFAEAAMLGHQTKKVYSETKKELFEDLQQLMDDQQKIIAQSPAAQARSRHNQQKVLFVGFAFNVVAAIILALFFLRGITNRIDVLIKNTGRLAKNAPLSPRLPGTDEISKLDHTFHDMADALAEAARLKQEFVAMVSHDLRTPLTSIQGFLHLLKEGVYGEVPVMAHQRTDVAIRSIDRLIGLINDLLDMEKMEAGKLEMIFAPTKLQPVIERTVDALRNFAEQHEVDLQVANNPEGDASAADLEVLADGDRLVQVLVNLVSNAIKFSPKGGAVIMSATREGDFATVRVADQGPGIPPQYIDAIFERFRQLPQNPTEKKGGTGLGLAICKAIIEQHAGTIGVDTVEGKGSTFWFRIPLQRS